MFETNGTIHQSLSFTLYTFHSMSGNSCIWWNHNHKSMKTHNHKLIHSNNASHGNAVHKPVGSRH